MALELFLFVEMYNFAKLFNSLVCVCCQTYSITIHEFMKIFTLYSIKISGEICEN